MNAALLLDHLCVSYRTPTGSVPALRDVSLALYDDEILGLVGESGSGKSTLAQAVMRLLEPDAADIRGRVMVGDRDLYGLTESELRQLRWRDVAMVFQSSMNALNPVLSVQDHFTDTFWAHFPTMGLADIRRKTAVLLEQVRLSPRVAQSYPHELSGGMRQRVVIALSLALNPRVLILDEPTTALDVVVQRSILGQVAALQRERRLAVLLISHDFTLVSSLAHRVAVMYAGELMEITDRGMGLEDTMPHHPYTTGLINATPRIFDDQVRIEGIPGEPPDMAHLPVGCSFYDRCPKRLSICRTTPLPQYESRTYIRCHVVGTQRVEGDLAHER